MIGGISAVLVATVFLVAACVHWRFYARRPVAFAVWRQPTRFDFGWPEPASGFGVLSKRNLLQDTRKSTKSVADDLEAVLRKIEAWHQGSVGSVAHFRIMNRDSDGPLAYLAFESLPERARTAIIIAS